MLIFNTGCSSDGKESPLTDSSVCTDGFLCNTDNTGIENVDINYETSNSTVTPNSAADLRVGDNIQVEVPSNGFTEESEFSVIHGFTEDKLGYNRYGESNITLLGNSPEMIMDIVEVSFEEKKLAGSIEIKINYNQEILDTMNENLRKEYSGIPEYTYSDLGLVYFDKSEGKFVSCNYEVDTSAHTFAVNTQIEGIYAVVIKPESFSKMSDYFKAHPDLVKKSEARAARESALISHNGSAGSSINFNSVDKRSTYETSIYKSGPWESSGGLNYSKNDKGEYEIATELPTNGPVFPATNCSGGVFGVIPALFFGDEPCYWHDWCYRYGYGTYNYSRLTCDNKFLNDMNNKVLQKFWNPNPQYFRILGKRISNPAFWVFEAIYTPYKLPLYASAYGVYKVVRVKGDGLNKIDDSGCVDYLNKGATCEIAKIRELRVEPNQLSFVNNEQIKFIPTIFSNRPEEYLNTTDNVKPDKMEWNITPNSGGFGAMSSSVNPNTTWSIPQDATPGIYTLTANLFDSGRIIHSKSVKLNVGTGNNAALSAGYNFGGVYPDYARSIKKDNSGNIYAAVSYGASASVAVGTHQSCHTEWCGNALHLFRCRKCNTVTDYADISKRTDYIVKFNASMEQIWAKDFPDKVINDLVFTPDGGVNSIIDGKTLVFIDKDGNITAQIDVSVNAWYAEKLLNDSFGNCYLIFSKPLGGVMVKKFNSSGSVLGEVSLLSGSTMSSSILKDNSIYILTGCTGYISVVKLDLNLVEQWIYDKTFSGAVSAGSITADNNGIAYITGEASADEINGSGATGKSCFIVKIDTFGNEAWIKGINGADFITVPQANQYYLASKRLPPLAAIADDGSIKVVSGTNENKTIQVWVENVSTCQGTDSFSGNSYSYICGTDRYQVNENIVVGSMVVRSYNSDGGVEAVKTIPSYNGTHYYDGLFVDTDGKINIYGSTTGRMLENSVNSGTLDWFYVKVEN